MQRRQLSRKTPNFKRLNQAKKSLGQQKTFPVAKLYNRVAPNKRFSGTDNMYYLSSPPPCPENSLADRAKDLNLSSTL